MQSLSLQEWSIVEVEFPFREVNEAKKRPALVVERTGPDLVLVKITGWATKDLHAGCVGLFAEDLSGTGLTKPSIIDLRAVFRTQVGAVQRVIGRLPIDNASLRRRLTAAAQHLPARR
jgi:hypothetical protein